MENPSINVLEVSFLQSRVRTERYFTVSVSYKHRGLWLTAPSRGNNFQGCTNRPNKAHLDKLPLHSDRFVASWKTVFFIKVACTWRSHSVDIHGFSLSWRVCDTYSAKSIFCIFFREDMHCNLLSTWQERLDLHVFFIKVVCTWRSYSVDIHGFSWRVCDTYSSKSVFCIFCRVNMHWNLLSAWQERLDLHAL